MASSSSCPQPRDIYHAFLGIEPEGIRRKVSEPARLYDVFINHRGPDSKQTLALPLYHSLKEIGIRAFLDKEEMEPGLSFPSTTESAIGSAAVHIAIFSKRYAECPWCLAELVLMLHSPAKIIPVFYEVEPSALRHIEKGVYGEAFVEYQKKSRYLDKLKQWKEALQSISYTTGYEINNLNISDHKCILSAVEREVDRIKPLHVAKYPVALDKLIQDFERRCLRKLVQDFEIHCGMNEEEERKAKIAGIFGMGGVGKTTLSKELFNRKRQQYARACFLFDVREASMKSNLSSLQRKVLKDLFDENELGFQSTKEGTSCICNCIERSTSLSFLLVLDDIDHLEQLDAFSISHMLEKPGNSLVIITTRDVGILVAEGIKVGHNLKGMDKDDARQLFSWHAFSQPHPASGYEDLVEEFVGVCGGLPLSLQVLGRHVHDRDESFWRIELQKVGRIMHRDIKKSLKISFDALASHEKQIFMDIACFFVDQLKDIAIRVWKTSGWSAQNGLQALLDKCLIEEIEDPVPVLRMHVQLRDLGREMANELRQPPRLWHPQDLKKLESKGLENIFSQTKGRCFHSFFDRSLNSEAQFFLGESEDDAEISSGLLWLHLLYPYYSRPYSSNLNHLSHQHQLGVSVQQTIPSWIPLQNMQCLRISNGSFERLWQQDAEAPSEMKELEICGTTLEEYPDFLGIITNVEKKVQKRVNEGQLMPEMKSLIGKARRKFSGSLPTNVKAPLNGGRKCATVKAPLSVLEDLVIKEQENIKSIVLNGNYCPNLQSIELSSMRNLIEVEFISVETLNCLNVSKCEVLKNLSVTSGLTELEELSISACPMLEEPNLGQLTCLKKIRIANCNMNCVPGISSLKMLVELNISRCPKLHELSLADLSCKEKLIVKDCDNLERVIGLSRLLKLVEVIISWCWMLQLNLCLDGLNCLKRIEVDRFVKVKSFELNCCKNLETISGISFEMTRMVNICGCPELRKLPVISAPSCLELTINGCRKLNYLTLTDCGILKRVSGNFDLVRLSISDCPMLQELPCFGRLIYLEEIRILQCGSLQNITLPTTVKKLTVQRCRNLHTVAGMGDLTKLAELYISECPEIEELPLFCGLSCLERITIDGYRKFNYLHVSDCAILKVVEYNFDLGHLAQLLISDCPELEELPCFASLTCLEGVRIIRCRKLQKLSLPRTLKNLQLESCNELKSVSEISCLKNLVELIISGCGQLELELRLEVIDSLQSITFDGCGKLKSFLLNKCQSLKKVSGNFGVERISIYGCPELEELSIHDCPGLSCLEKINIESCHKLQNVTLPTKLIKLIVQRCRHLPRIAGMDDLTELCISECDELDKLPSLAKLSCLVRIEIDSCQKLHSIRLPTSINELSLHRCTGLQMVEGIGSLLKLTEMSLSECPELEELPILAGLSCLITIRIHSCRKLHSITLPTTRKNLTVQWCRKLQMVAGMGDLTKLTDVHISKCPDLDNLPVLFGLSSLESIKIDGCGKLNRLKVAECWVSKGVSCSFDPSHLAQLWISDCPALEELPCFARLNCLEEICIIRCTKLQKITLPVTLKILHLESCKDLQNVSKMGDLSKLKELYISECPEIEELPILAGQNNLERIIIYSCEKLHKVTLPMTLKRLQLQGYRKFQKVLGMGDPKKLTLVISKCPKLEQLTVPSGPSSLERLTIDGCEKLNRLLVADCAISKGESRSFDLCQLARLWISDCPELEELPCLASLPCLEGVRIIRCRKLHKISFPRTLKNLHLDSCNELKSVSEISCLENLVELIISGCGQLELELRLEEMDSLQRIIFDSSRKIKYFLLNRCGNLKRVSGNFDVEWISISGCPELEELCIHDCPGLSCMEKIIIESCDRLQNITLPTKLIKLIVQRCRHLPRIVGMDNLTELCISECEELHELPILAKLSCLVRIEIDSCQKLHSIKLPTTLNELSLHRCTGLQMVQGIGSSKAQRDVP